MTSARPAARRENDLRQPESNTGTARVEQHDLDTRLQQYAARTTTPARTRTASPARVEQHDLCASSSTPQRTTIPHRPNSNIVTAGVEQDDLYMYLQQHAARTTTPSRTVTARVEQHDLDTRLQQHAVRTTTPARTRRPPAPPPASSSTTPLHALPAARRKNDDASSNSESRSSRSPTLCRNGSSSAPARRAAQIPGASECGGREDLPLAQEGASQRLRPRGRQCRRATRRPTAHARSHPPATRVTTHTAETPSTPYSRTCCTNTRPATAPSRRTAGRGRTAAVNRS